MATLTPGYIYLIEAQGDLGGDDFIVTHAGDPEDIVIGNYTEGLSYAKLQIPKQFVKNFITGAVVKTGSGGNQYFEMSAKRSYTLLAEGIETTVANADLVDEFCMSERHTSGIPGAFKQYYLVIKLAVNSYVKFTDSEGNRQKYCRGIILNGSIIHIMKQFRATVRLNWASVW